MNITAAGELERLIEGSLARGEYAAAEEYARQYRSLAELKRTDRSASGTFFRSHWFSAQVALSEGRLGIALSFLESVLPLDNLSGWLLVRVRLAFAEVLARLQRVEEARRYLPSLEVDAALADGEVLLLLRNVRIRLWLGEVELLDEVIQRCLNRLHDMGDRLHAALLWCDRGRAYDEAGKDLNARRCWQEAAQCATGTGGAILADVLIQLARAEHLHGHLQNALDHLDSAAGATQTVGQVGEIHLRRALVLLDLNQQSQAEAELDRVQLLTARADLPEEVQGLHDMVESLLDGERLGNGREVLAYQRAKRGDVEEARRLYEMALSEANSLARQGRMALALGMLAVAASDGNEARRWLQRAETIARQEHLPEVLWRTLQAQGQVAAQLDGDEERARELMEQAVVVSEGQLARLRHRLDAVTHGARRQEILRALLRGACRRGDAASVFRYQELERGRLLLEMWRGMGASVGGSLGEEKNLKDVEADIAAWESGGRIGDVKRLTELLLARDRLLDAHLRDRSRRSAAALPALCELSDLAGSLSSRSVYLAPVVLDEEIYLLTARRGGPCEVVRCEGTGKQLAKLASEFRAEVDSQLERYRAGLHLGKDARRQLELCLDALGNSGLGREIWAQLRLSPHSEIVWVADGCLQGLPLCAWRMEGHYLVETHSVVHHFGGSLVHYLNQSKPRRGWLQRVLAVSETETVLPAARREGEGVVATFSGGKHLSGMAAGQQEVRSWLGKVEAIHFACHAYFDANQPLSACIGLPTGERWQALSWLDEKLDGMPLVTLSACRSAEVGPLAGREVFGLVTGLLGAGVRAVVAGMWPVADNEVVLLMWRFYRNRLTADLATALAQSQREALATSDGSPLFWAALGLYGDSHALPKAGRWTRWLAQWRQRWHLRRYPN